MRLCVCVVVLGLCGGFGPVRLLPRLSCSGTVSGMRTTLTLIANQFFPILAMVAVGSAAALLVSRRLRESFTADVLLMLAAVVASVMMGGSLFYSEVAMFLPCVLCWVQRGFAYPLVPALWAAKQLPKLHVKRVVSLMGAVMAALGLCVSIYHYLLQRIPALSTGTFCDPSNPCSAAYVMTWGFVSIPFMAGCGFVALTVLLFFAARGFKAELAEEVAEEADAG